jgi:enolase
MSIITSIHAREILDSRGNPTLEAEVVLDSGAAGRAAVPSGASTGEFEAVELRDGDAGPLPRQGRDARGVERVQEIAEAMIGMDATDQAAVDRAMIELDGTPNKSALGANAILAVSLAVPERRPWMPACRCTATSADRVRRCCPCPLMNILNGGAHAANNVDLQEFMIAPVGMDTFPKRCAPASRSSTA